MATGVSAAAAFGVSILQLARRRRAPAPVRRVRQRAAAHPVAGRRQRAGPARTVAGRGPRPAGAGGVGRRARRALRSIWGWPRSGRGAGGAPHAGRRPHRWRPGRRPLVDAVLEKRASVIVLDRTAQADDGDRRQAAVLHEAGVRIRTLVQFYEEWLGKLPVGELERASLFFDISEIHRARYAAGEAADGPGPRAGGPDPFVAGPCRWCGWRTAFGNRGPLFYRQDRVGRNGVPFDDPQVPQHDADSPGRRRRRHEWTAVDDPGSRRSAGCCGRRTSTSCRRWSTSSAATCRWSGRGPSSPGTSRSSASKLPFYGMRHLVRPGPHRAGHR